MELPIGIGKTITNEPFIFDLTKMPHLLIAGATGQGKSVGLNALITSLLYSKRPEELKFVMVDPKMLEFSIYEEIERHFLAKLPDAERAIITDMTKVVATLNSLCIEMDNRYRLLQTAGRAVRNIREYNEQVRSGALKRIDGHEILPYIVLIVDEFADLMMTVGKEVEQPIARLRAEGTCRRDPHGHRDTAPLDGRHHRAYQGKLPRTYRLQGLLYGRLPHRPRLPRGEPAHRSRRTCSSIRARI